MSIALDPSEMRAPVEGRAPAAPRAPSRIGRLALLTALGGVGLVGLSAGAYSMLSGLAGPPPTKVRMGRVSADWPDLRDGVPALAAVGGTPISAPAASVVRVREAVSADPVPARVVAVPTEAGTTQPGSAGPKPVEAKPAEAKPARLPVIENAATVPPAPAVALVEKARTAPLVAPTAIETTRARATTGGTFAALPPAASDETTRQKPLPAVARTKPAAQSAARSTVKPTARSAAVPNTAAVEKVAAAQPPQAVEPEAEETEMFGMKVPSLAPMGRKFAEGVEALGNAVRRLPDQF